MVRVIAVLSLLMCVWASGLSAQIAVPELAPAATRLINSRGRFGPQTNIVPENPAALQWGSPSRVGGGAGRGKKRDSCCGTSDTFNLTLGGFRWVSPSFAIGAEGTQLTVELPTTLGVDPRIDSSQTAIGLAVRWPNSVAWGIGAQSLTQELVFPGLMPNEQHFDVKTVTAGVSWSIDENLFVGAYGGKDTLTRTVPTTNGDATRSIQGAGLGLRGGGAVIWHAELDYFHYGDYTSDVSQLSGGGYDLGQIVIEGIWANLLFGYGNYQTRDAEQVGGISPVPLDIKGYTTDFGYAPLQGLTLTWRYENSTVTSPTASGPLSKEQYNAVMIGWQF